MAKFATVTKGGYYWLCFEGNGRRIYLHIQGRVGDCIRPGQKMRD